MRDRYDAQRTFCYDITVMHGKEKTMIGKHIGLSADRIVHDFPEIVAEKIIITITEVKADCNGCVEPGISNVEVYYLNEESKKL